MSSDYLISQIEDERYAIEIESVEKIIENQKCVKVSGLNENIDGVINYDGFALKVINLRRVVNKLDNIPKREKIVIYKRDKKRVGIRVDAIETIMSISVDDAKENKIKKCEIIKFGKVYELERGKLVTMIEDVIVV